MELLDRLNAIEARLDPGPLKRGRLVADVATVVVAGSVGWILDWQVSHPMFLLGVLLTATGLNHLIPNLARRSLRRERERLTVEYEELTTLVERPPPRAS